MNIKHSLFYYIVLPIYITFLYILIANYDSGDQTVYRELYSAFSNTNWKDVLSVSVYYVTGYELVSPYLLWLGAKLSINKDIYITILNFALVFSLTRWLFHRKTAQVYIFLIITNFYTIVLLTSAERLKISYIFLALAVFYIRNKKMLILFILLAILSHMQTIVLLSGILIYFFIKEYGSQLLRFKINKKLLLQLCLFIVMAAFLFPLLGEEALNKSSAYSSDVSSRDATVVLQAFVLYISVFSLLGRSFAFSLMSMYFIICIIVLGGTRVNMIYFTAVFFILVYEGHLVKIRIKNIPFFIILSYLTYKSISYVGNIFAYGDGFYS